MITINLIIEKNNEWKKNNLRMAAAVHDSGFDFSGLTVSELREKFKAVHPIDFVDEILELLEAYSKQIHQEKEQNNEKV